MTHVLVVEDEPALWRVYGRALRQKGHTCCWASSFSSARTLIAHMVLGVEPMASVAIVDLELQGSVGSGVEVLKLLPTFIQPIVVSGHDVEEVRRRVEFPFTRVNVYLSKPLTASDYETLWDAVERAEGGRAGGKADR